MSLVAEFTVPVEEYAFDGVLNEDTSMRIEFERLVPTDRRLGPYVWIGSETAPTALAEDLEADPYVETIQEVARAAVDDRILYELSWTARGTALFESFAAADGILLRIVGSDQWYFRFRFPSHVELKHLHLSLVEQDFPLNLKRVSTLSEGLELSSRLTPPQRESLVLAMQHGYFKIPRQTTIEELATQLNISEQAFSQRLRRGIDKVLPEVVA